jgi:hypothetical protein
VRQRGSGEIIARGTAMKRGVKYVIGFLVVWAVIAVVVLFSLRVKNALAIAALVLVVVGYVAFRIYSASRLAQNSSKLQNPWVSFRLALVFLFGAAYGAWQSIEEGWKWTDLLLLIIPLTFVIWLTREGLKARARIHG